ncbi:MAG: SprB repeat-containing protein [Crocinitomicaceae bacterium]
MKNLFFLTFLFFFKIGFSQITVSVTAGEPTCFGAQNGSILLQVSGGVFPYSYYIVTEQNDTINNNMNTANFLYGDQYYYYSVTDASGLTINDSTFLNQPSAITINGSIVQPNLPPDLGTIEVTNVTNVVYPVHFLLTSSNGAAIPSQSISTPATVQFPNLDTGLYSLQVVDDNGCTEFFPTPIEFQSPIPPITFNLQVNQPTTASPVGSITIQNIQGNISPEASLKITVMDGASSLYPITGLTSSNLGPEVYTVTVADTITTMSHTDTAVLQYQDLAIDDLVIEGIEVSTNEFRTITISGLELEDEGSIYTLDGRQVISFLGEKKTLSIELTTGIYVAVIRRGKKRMSQKVLCR